MSDGLARIRPSSLSRPIREARCSCRPPLPSPSQWERPQRSPRPFPRSALFAPRTCAPASPSPPPAVPHAVSRPPPPQRPHRGTAERRSTWWLHEALLGGRGTGGYPAGGAARCSGGVLRHEVPLQLEQQLRGEQHALLPAVSRRARDGHAAEARQAVLLLALRLRGGAAAVGPGGSDPHATPTRPHEAPRCLPAPHSPSGRTRRGTRRSWWGRPRPAAAAPSPAWPRPAQSRRFQHRPRPPQPPPPPSRAPPALLTRSASMLPFMAHSRAVCSSSRAAALRPAEMWGERAAAAPPPPALTAPRGGRGRWGSGGGRAPAEAAPPRCRAAPRHDSPAAHEGCTGSGAAP